MTRAQWAAAVRILILLLNIVVVTAVIYLMVPGRMKWNEGWSLADSQYRFINESIFDPFLAIMVCGSISTFVNAVPLITFVTGDEWPRGRCGGLAGLSVVGYGGYIGIFVFTSIARAAPDREKLCDVDESLSRGCWQRARMNDEVLLLSMIATAIAMGLSFVECLLKVQHSRARNSFMEGQNSQTKEPIHGPSLHV